MRRRRGTRRVSSLARARRTSSRRRSNKAPAKRQEQALKDAAARACRRTAALQHCLCSWADAGSHRHASLLRHVHTLIACAVHTSCTPSITASAPDSTKHTAFLHSDCCSCVFHSLLQALSPRCSHLIRSPCHSVVSSHVYQSSWLL